MKKMGGKKKKSGSAKKSLAMSSLMSEESFFNDGASSSNSSAMVAKKSVPSASKNVEDVDGNASGAEMKKILEGFSSRIEQEFQDKHQKVKKYTEESTSATVKKVIETCRIQSGERRSAVGEFYKEMVKFLDEIKKNLMQEKKFCDKNQDNPEAQINQICWNASNRNQQVERMKEASAQFFQDMNDMTEAYIQRYSQVHNDISKLMDKM